MDEWKEYISATFGISLSEEAVAKFRVYLSELEDWNLRMNLVSFRSPQEILWRHFADSIAGAKIVREYQKNLTESSGAIAVADIGTGAGFRASHKDRNPGTQAHPY